MLERSFVDRKSSLVGFGRKSLVLSLSLFHADVNTSAIILSLTIISGYFLLKGSGQTVDRNPETSVDTRSFTGRSKRHYVAKLLTQSSLLVYRFLL